MWCISDLQNVAGFMFCCFIYSNLPFICLLPNVIPRVRPDLSLMVFNATFNNISVISWRSVLLEETRGPGENHRPVASHWQILSHNVVHLALIEIQTHNMSGDSNWCVMVSMLASSVVDRGFEPRLGQTKNCDIGICCFSAKHAALRRKSKDW